VPPRSPICINTLHKGDDDDDDNDDDNNNDDDDNNNNNNNNNKNTEAAFIDIAFPLTHSLQTTNTEKQSKYQVWRLKQQWQLNKFIVIPLVLSATVDIPNMLNQSHSAHNVPPHLLSQVQKVALLNCSIVRMFLTAEVHLPDVTTNHAILQCSRPYTLIAIIPDATPRQPALWLLDNARHSLRQSQITNNSPM
jgi:hypothetical protein